MVDIILGISNKNKLDFAPRKAPFFITNKALATALQVLYIASKAHRKKTSFTEICLNIGISYNILSLLINCSLLWNSKCKSKFIRYNKIFSKLVLKKYETLPVQTWQQSLLWTRTLLSSEQFNTGQGNRLHRTSKVFFCKMIYSY